MFPAVNAMDFSAPLPKPFVSALEGLVGSTEVELGHSLWEDLVDPRQPLTNISPTALGAALAPYCLLLGKSYFPFCFSCYALLML